MSTDYTSDETWGGGPGSERLEDSGASRVRSRLAVNIGLLLLFATLIIDGFPVGEAALHEFGARITNFLLIIVWMAIAVRRVMKRQATSFSTREMYLLIAIFIAVPVFNIPVTLVQAQAGATGVLADWIKQYLMLCWGVVSFFLWRAPLRSVEPKRYCDLTCAAAILPVLLFYLE